MIFRKDMAIVSLAAILFFILAWQLPAQMNPICRFKKVTIPVNLRINDALLEKGAYDLEFLRANPRSYYLRIMKNGRILHLVQGEEFLYDNSSVMPRKTVLKMSKNTAEKTLTLVMESGTDTVIYAMVRARYSFPYEGE